jgi:predicted nucleic acid-binding protein
MPLLVDTGALYALADADDVWHVPVRDFVRRQRQSLLVPVTVTPEAAYLIRSRLGAKVERRFIESLAAAELAVEDLTRTDLNRCAELMESYEFLGFVDASVVAIAERLKLRALVTTDRRDFGRVRPKHTTAFELLP